MWRANQTRVCAVCMCWEREQQEEGGGENEGGREGERAREGRRIWVEEGRVRVAREGGKQGRVPSATDKVSPNLNRRPNPNTLAMH